jgi:pimeloyl-ACP methyl ester carboxylesterase
MTLGDGRTLCFDDVGDPGGAPVVYVHGTPDSRRARHPDDDLNLRIGIRMIAIDRPGAGGSSPHPDGTVGSFADDVAELADHLGIARLALLGWSAGAVPALAVAARHPRLVTGVGVVAGLPPVAAYAEPGILDDASTERRGVAELAATAPPAEVGRILAPLVAPWPCDLDLARDHVSENADEVRLREIGSVPGAIDAMAAGVVDAVAQGLGGLEHDLAMSVTPPDIDLADVRCRVQLWYGSLDHSAPASFGRWFADHLAVATLRVVDGAGHCLILPRWTEILRSVLPDRPDRADLEGQHRV